MSDWTKKLMCPDHKFRLTDISSRMTPGTDDRQAAEEMTDRLTEKIREQQMRLFVNGTKALLVVLQGMDTCGKDGTVRAVFSRVNPSGCLVTSFKQPTPLEKQHDFLWRAHAAVPPLGAIGIFNRSYYEDVLIVRVHAKTLLPSYLREEKGLWKWRFKLINTFEEMLAKDGITILKIFLHISKDEQRERLQDRQNQKAKQWKLFREDIAERAYWDDYMKVYSECLEHTHTAYAPWHIIPADHKWYRNFAVATLVEKALSRLKLPVPAIRDPGVLKIKIR
jgi:PPK2 family polyphosphate:nucleotide phosphotransferase